MPRNILNVTRLRRAIHTMIGLQPVHVQTWVVVAGDGLVSPQSYAYSYSYVGMIADLGRQVLRDFAERGAADVGPKPIVVILPYIAGKPVPRKNDKVILFRMDGSEYARFWVNHVAQYDVETPGSTENAIYKTELLGELIES